MTEKIHSQYILYSATFIDLQSIEQSKKIPWRIVLKLDDGIPLAYFIFVQSLVDTEQQDFLALWCLKI